MARLKYAGLIKAQKFSWGSVYLWKAARETPSGRREYVYLTIYIKARARGRVQITVYLDSAEELAKRLAGIAPGLRQGGATPGSP